MQWPVAWCDHCCRTCSPTEGREHGPWCEWEFGETHPARDMQALGNTLRNWPVAPPSRPPSEAAGEAHPSGPLDEEVPPSQLQAERPRAASPKLTCWYVNMRAESW